MGIANSQQATHELLSVLCHDLRTPLSAISGWLFLLDSDRLDAAAKKRAIEKIRRNVNDQVRMIDDVNLLSRVLSGQLQMEAVLTSPMAILELAIEKLRVGADASSVRLVVVNKGSDHVIKVDADLMRRLLEILALHVLKSTPAGGAIELLVDSDAGAAQFVIHDNGKQMPYSEVSRVFDGMKDGADSTENIFAGAGRNLLLAKLLAVTLGGSLCAESVGSEPVIKFTIRMPEIDGKVSSNDGTGN